MRPQTRKTSPVRYTNWALRAGYERSPGTVLPVSDPGYFWCGRDTRRPELESAMNVVVDRNKGAVPTFRGGRKVGNGVTAGRESARPVRR